MTHDMLFFFFPFMVIAAGAFDALTMRIPNWISIALAIGFLIAAPLVGLALSETAWHLVAGVVGLAIGFTVFALGWFGGGDAKLAAVIALWLGWSQATITFILIAAICGGGLGMALILFRTSPLPPLALSSTWLNRLHQKNGGMPYGVALAAGAVLAYSASAVPLALGGS